MLVVQVLVLVVVVLDPSVALKQLAGLESRGYLV
jgi:hypothetical protein